MTQTHIEKLTSEEIRNLITSGRTSGKRMAFEFWLKNLHETVPKSQKFDKAQIRYVARLLTIPTLLSADPETIYFPTADSLLKIYHDSFNSYEDAEPKIMEIAACQAMLLSGFYRDSTKKKCDLQLLERMGKIFLGRAAIGKKEKVISGVVRIFGEWNDQLCYLEWYLRNERLVIPAGEPEEPLIKIIPR